MINELAYPGKSGEKTTITIANQTLEVEKIEGKYVLGDMLFSNGFSKSTGIIGKRWPNNTVPYSIYPNLAKKDRVIDAIAHWEAKTPL